MVDVEKAREQHAAEECKAEILRRIERYKKPPSMAALSSRLEKYCDGAHSVEWYTLTLVKEGKLRVTDGVFCLPKKWDAFSDLG